MATSAADREALAASSTVVTLRTGSASIGNSARAASAFNSPVMRATSWSTAASVWTPPHDFHDVFSFRLGREYIRMGWMRTGLPGDTSGRCGSQKSWVQLALAAGGAAIAPAAPSPAKERKSRRIRVQHIQIFSTEIVANGFDGG